MVGSVALFAPYPIRPCQVIAGRLRSVLIAPRSPPHLISAQEATSLSVVAVSRTLFSLIPGAGVRTRVAEVWGLEAL